MEFSNEQLKALISRNFVGQLYPYNTSEQGKVEKYIQQLFQKMNTSDKIICAGEFMHYGSGYASYVDLFCYKKDGSGDIEERYIEKDQITSIKIEGLTVYVSRLAPVAVISRQQRYKSIREFGQKRDEYYSGFTFIEPNEVMTNLNGFMEEEFEELTKKLKEAGYFILDKEYITKPLQFKTKIHTLLSIPDFGDTYKIFDAIFYWTD
jgi:hypothetical protein